MFKPFYMAVRVNLLNCARALIFYTTGSAHAPKFRPREIHEEIVKSLLKCSKMSASSVDDMTASLHPKHPKNEWIPCQLSESGLQKGTFWQLSAQPLLVTKNSKILYTAFNHQRRKRTDRTLYSGTVHG